MERLKYAWVREVFKGNPAPPTNTIATKLLIQTVGFPKQLLLLMLPRPSTLIHYKHMSTHALRGHVFYDAGRVVHVPAIAGPTTYPNA